MLIAVSLTVGNVVGRQNCKKRNIIKQEMSVVRTEVTFFRQFIDLILHLINT